VITDVAQQVDLLDDVVSVPVLAADADGDSLSFSAAGLPDGVSIDPSRGLLSGTLVTAGNYSVTVTVDDGQATDSTTFAWVVIPPNRPPVITQVGDQTSTVGEQITLSLQVVDLDGDALSFTATGLPDGLSIGQSVITGSPTVAGTFTVTVTVSDGQAADSTTFTWVIQDVNSAPIGVPIPPLTVASGETISLVVTATDADGDQLFYLASSGPPTGLPFGLTLDSNTGLISGTIGNAAGDMVQTVVDVVDSVGNSDTITIDWVITS